MNSLKTFFDILKKSLFDISYYKKVAKENFWSSYKYLLFFLFILTIVKTLQLGGLYLVTRPQIKPAINKFMVSAENFYPDNLELKIKNGQLSTNVKEPYIFDADQKPARHLLVIDTKGSIEKYPSYNTYILATKNALIYPSRSRNNFEETSVFFLNNLKQDFTLNKNVYVNLFNSIKPFSQRIFPTLDYLALAVLFLILVFGSLFWSSSTMIGLVFLTLFVWVINLIFKRSFKYGALYKMGLHAVTLPIIVNELFRLFSLTIPAAYSIIFVFFMILVLFS